MPLIPNLSLYLIQKFDRLALWGNLTILELHFAETQVVKYLAYCIFLFRYHLNLHYLLIPMLQIFMLSLMSNKNDSFSKWIVWKRHR